MKIGLQRQPTILSDSEVFFLAKITRKSSFCTKLQYPEIADPKFHSISSHLNVLPLTHY